MNRTNWRSGLASCIAMLACAAVAVFDPPAFSLDAGSKLAAVAAISLLSVGIAYVLHQFAAWAIDGVTAYWRTHQTTFGAVLRVFYAKMAAAYGAYKARRAGARPTLSPTWRRCGSIGT